MAKKAQSKIPTIKSMATTIAKLSVNKSRVKKISKRKVVVDGFSFILETGIPIPSTDQPSTLSKYPYAKMEVGDSYFIPATTARERCVARTSTAYYSRKYKLKFTSRSDKSGVRIWRIK